MNRRNFLKRMAWTVAGAGLAPGAMIRSVAAAAQPPISRHDGHLKDYLYKIRHFDATHPDDVFLGPAKFGLLRDALQRLTRIQRTVGHGNFYLLNFDEALAYARNYTRIGSFTKAEIAFLEEIFYEDGALYGFFGEKPLKNLTDRIPESEVVKIEEAGNYLYKGLAEKVYARILKDVGDQVVLTSGVRSVIKQFMLFLGKAYSSDGNLSLASRSLAPPGYSYHGVGDFDVGQVGFGYDNFTARFTETDTFRRLEELGYINLRYQQDNMLGVRFEPWHIKITPHA